MVSVVARGLGFLVGLLAWAAWRVLRLAVHALAVALFWAGLGYCRAWRSRSRPWWLVVAVHSPAGAVAIWVSAYPVSALPAEGPPVVLVLPAVGLVTVAALLTTRFTARAAARPGPAPTARALPVPHHAHPHPGHSPLGGSSPGEDGRVRFGALRALASEPGGSGGLLPGLRQTLPLLSS